MSRLQGVGGLSQLGRLLFLTSFQIKCERNFDLKVFRYHGPISSAFTLSIKWRPEKNVHFFDQKKKKTVIV